MHVTLTRTTLLLLALLIGPPTSHALAVDSAAVKFLANGKYQLGISLARDATTWLILANDGQLHYLDSPATFAKSSSWISRFKP